MKLKISNQTKIQGADEKRLKMWLAKTLEIAKAPEDKIKDGHIELFYLPDAEIAKWNKVYRGKGKSTDVLSFSFIERPAFPADNLVGQVFISPEIAKKQAGENCWSLSQEIEFLFVHAILHILGYDHETKNDFEKMFGLHLEIMKNVPAVKEVIEKYRKESF